MTFTETRIGRGVFYTGDCFEVMATLRDGSADMVLCDLPYGTTQNKWDSVLPLAPLWEQYWRLCTGAVVLTAAQPFTSALVMSQVKKFKYDWAWQKNRATNVFNAKKQPLRDREDILVFCQGVTPYSPQGLIHAPEPSRNGKKDSDNWGAGKTGVYVKTHGNYPKQTLKFDVVQRVSHPTQKPVELFEYMIRTYINPGDIVLDNCAGSGTTAIAAENAERRWICIERDETYAAMAIERIREHVGADLL